MDVSNADINDMLEVFEDRDQRVVIINFGKLENEGDEIRVRSTDNIEDYELAGLFHILANQYKPAAGLDS